MDTQNHDDVLWVESLERAIEEVEALQAIYDCHGEVDGNKKNDFDSNQIVMILKCHDELEKAKSMLQIASTPHLQVDEIPVLELEMVLHHVMTTRRRKNKHQNSNERLLVHLYFRLVPGYPSRKPVIARIVKATTTATTAKGILSKQQQEIITQKLQSKAKELIGFESIMVLTQECQEHIMRTILVCDDDEGEQQQQEEEHQCTTGSYNNNLENDNDPSHPTSSSSSSSSSSATIILERRWIWVHHITDKQRKIDIVQEANDHGLGGYLKEGYSGIVVIEGTQKSCNDFVSWIKGNKSRPGGGFGRQWGHHVKGQLMINKQQLPKIFQSIKEDMSVLASLCREHDLEEEFLTFVMQHG